MLDRRMGLGMEREFVVRGVSVLSQAGIAFAPRRRAG